MSISVIIPTLNEEGYINNLLDDLYRQSTMPYEIIVVDGKSSDKTVKVIQRYSKVQLCIIEPDVASQRNYGAGKATGDILMFLDADVRLPADFLQDVVLQFENNTLDIVCPYYVPYRSSLLTRFIYIFFNILFFFFQKIAPSGAGSCIICRKEIFLKDVGFRNKFKFDDIEMIRRYGYNFQFSMLKGNIYVSDRRFQREGRVKLFLKYLILSLFFITNQFRLANNIDYQFGTYKK